MYTFVKNAGSTTPHPWLKMITMIVLVLVNGMCCHGCWEQERIALLHLKASINDPSGTSLPSWVDNRNANCCQWEAVECSNNSKRVVKISLTGTWDWRLGNYEWHFNTSLFLPFEGLKALNLSGNGLVGWVNNEGFKRLSKVINLEVLDLSHNQFNDTILEFVGEISSLKSLYLASNNMGTSIDLNSFKRLSMLINLEVLDLSYNSFNDTILEFVGEISSLRSLSLANNDINMGTTIDLKSFKRLSMLINLEVLDLNYNSFNDTILEFVGKISSLRSLSLAYNDMGTSIDLNSFKRLSMLINLEVLDLSDNSFNDTILKFVSEISSLRTLSLANNDMGTSIDLNSFKRLSMLINLEVLDLSKNSFNDTILEFVGEISSLRSLSLRENDMGTSIDLNSFKRLSMLINLEVLDLSHNQFNDTILEFVGEISSLRSLSLADNDMGTSIDLNSFKRLSMLINLEVFDLSGNKFNDTILEFVGEISSLRSLSLTNNDMETLIDLNSFKGLSMLTNLEVLDLSGNQFNDTILKFVGEILSLRSLSLAHNYMGRSIDLNSFRRLSRLSNFELLDLSNNNLNSSTILTSIGGISSLKFLDLSYNYIGGSIEISSLCQLKTLQELNIRRNELWGTLPWCLANLTSLRLLDISFNYFNGNIAFSPLINLTTLRYLALSDNQFEVPISFKSFLNHSKLKVLQSLNNKLVVEGECNSSTPSFQLEVIRLSDSKSSNNSVSFPHFLYHQNELQMIELSGIDFNGKWPNWLLENNSRLVALLMPDNSLHGSILWLPLNPVTRLSDLDISNNHIEGYIPNKLASIFPGLVYLNMSANGFKGDIPSSLGDLTFLQFLDLSNNRLSGKIPAHLVKGCEFLKFLSLRNNNLTGSFLPPQTKSSTIEFLLLDNNHFTKIPDSLSINSLSVLNVGHNQLAGKIPGWIWNLLTLQTLSLSNNNFEGPIPIEFCELQYLFELDLSNNYFTGIVPFCFSNLSVLEFVSLSNNRLSGPFPEGFHNSFELRVLDLSNNCLSNDIPKWIGNLSHLQKLLLKNNSFEGIITDQICHLSNLTVIDLSWNNFFGDIPHCLHTTEVEGAYPGWLGVPMPVISLLDNFKIVSKMTRSQYDYKLGNQMEFTTKGMALLYKGVPLQLFSAIDLSNNKLTGCIPPGIGSLSHIKSLNLSHNNLTGPIPATFSNLENIESLDLSYNSLQGNIPYKLTGLHYLEKFNVSYNNLSGRIPQGPNQFRTFDGSSYIGNPLLCGEEVANSCNSSPPTASPNNGSEVEFSFIDMDTFYMSFAGSYLTMPLAIAGILYIKPHWRRVWFRFVEVFITSCYYFVMDNL